MSDRESLLPLQLEGVTDTGIVVGDGSYATVKQLDFRGLKCVGKKLHALLYQLANPRERAEMLHRFAGECELLSRLHHPCIVQFLGVYFEEGSQLPVLVMEYLYTNLSSCLKEYGILPTEISYPILRDVALGLRYMHESSPSIIHRDLSANNVLLTAEMNAKISDLGVAKILDLSPAQITQRISTQTPGTPCYMPPEALVSKPTYTSKIDNYSYGVLLIHCLCGRWPFPGDAFREDPANPGALIPISEIERRGEYLQEIGLDHPLIELIRRCLSNTPTSRPEASEILQEVEGALADVVPLAVNKIEMLQRVAAQGQGQEVDVLRAEVESRGRRIKTLVSEIEAKKKENESQKGEILSLKEKLVTLQPAPELSVVETPIPAQYSETKYSTSPSPPAATEEPAGPSSLPPGDEDNQTPVHPQVKLKWKRSVRLPMKMASLQSVLVGAKAYVGGGKADRVDEQFLVCQYDPEKDCWEKLPPCPVKWFALGQFQGRLITVGGDTRQGVVTDKVYEYKEESRRWKETLKPMPTPRYHLSIITTQSSIIACGGMNRLDARFATVEIYIAETKQWHEADPLPLPCYSMTPVVIDDTCYLLGGNGRMRVAIKTLLRTSVSSLIESARESSTSTPNPQRGSAWKTLTPSPLLSCTAVSLGGHLLAIGGCKEQACSTVHMLLPPSYSWVEVDESDLPVARFAATALQLTDNSKVLVCGGRDYEQKLTNSVYVGTMDI